MFNFYVGTDAEKVRSAVYKELAQAKKENVRITDAHSLSDLTSVLQQGESLFGEKKMIVLDSLLGGSNEELATKLLSSLAFLRKSKERFVVVEGSIDASTRKMIEKHAEHTFRFDLPKKAERNTIFDLANAMQSGNKKTLWIAYHRELQKGSAPEAIQGVLFWAAKQMVQARSSDVSGKGHMLLTELVSLPHEARRNGFDLEYALERFVLSLV